MDSISKQCLYCAKKINGRTDKKFCNSYCRSGFHNAQFSDKTNYMRQINLLLQRNRKILAEVFTQNTRKKTIALSELYLRGFLANHFTHQQKDQKEGLCFFCYDYGYRIIGKDTVKIVQVANI